MKALLFALFFSAVPLHAEGSSPCAGGIRILRDMAPVPSYSIKTATVLEIDPEACDIRAVSAAALGKGKITLHDVSSEFPQAIAAVNASFFDPKTGKIIGLYIEQGRTAATTPDGSMRGIFSLDAKGIPSITYATALPKEAKPVTAVSGKLDWSQTDPEAPRTAICITSAGKIKIASLYPVESLEKTARFMQQEEGCEKVVHLDGGGSAQLLYRPAKIAIRLGKIPRLSAQPARFAAVLLQAGGLVSGSSTQKTASRHG